MTLDIRESWNKKDVIFAGEDSNGGEQGEYTFGFYARVDNTAIWLPAIATNKQVIAQLKDMKLGQVFKITSEKTGGGMGTNVRAIDIKQDALIYDIPKNVPPTLDL